MKFPYEFLKNYRQRPKNGGTSYYLFWGIIENPKTGEAIAKPFGWKSDWKELAKFLEKGMPGDGINQQYQLCGVAPLLDSEMELVK